MCYLSFFLLFRLISEKPQVTANMRHVSALTVCLLVLIISLDTVKSRWIDDEQMAGIPIKYKYLRDTQKKRSNKENLRQPSHFIRIAGLDNMDIMTTILEEARQRGGSFNLRRKGESPNHDLMLNDLRKLLETAGKRR